VLPTSKPTPSFLRGDDNDIRKEQFKRHEKKVIADLNGTGTIGSGNKGMKGDAHGGNADAGQRVMAEAKSTKAKQITLQLGWLEKLVREALSVAMEPVLLIRFDATKLIGARDWAVVPAERYKELLEAEAELRLAKGSYGG
jgi:Holliday junction resolvase